MSAQDQIKQLVKDFKTKSLMKDKTDAMGDGLLIAASLSDDSNELSKDVQAQVDQLVIEGDSSVEAAQARVDGDGESYTTLKKRLDGKEQEVTAQFAQVAYIITGINDLIKAVNTTEERTVIIGSSLDLTTDLYVPKNIRLIFRNNGRINVASMVSLTIDGYIDAGHYQLFSFVDETAQVTTTNVGTLGETSEPTNIKYNIKLSWFGAKGDAIPPLGNIIGTNLPTGTDDTKAIKRAIDFANKASINGTLTKLKNPMVTVEAQPNTTYLVKGNNILGVQSENYKSVCYRFDGNGCQFLHHVQSENDSFIDNGYLMIFPSFKNLSVDIYINNGSTRLGNFFNLNGYGKTTIKMFRPEFDRIRVSANSEEYGYKNIYKIDGSTMADNGSVSGGYYATFEKFFNCSNLEAVNWEFRKNYLHPTTENGCIYYINGVISGPFKSIDNEVRLSKNGENYLKTIGSNITGGIFELLDRVEIGGGIAINVLDLDYGEVLMKGINFYAGNGGILPNTSSFFAKIGTYAKLVIESCRIPMKEFLIKNIDLVSVSSPKEMLIIKDTSINNGTSSGHPYLVFDNSAGTRLTLANVYDSNFPIRKVKVVNPQGEENVFDYEYGSKKAEIKSIMLSKNVGSSSYAEGFRIRVPYNFVIKQIRLINASHLISEVDGIRISLQYSTGSEWVYSTTIPLDGNVNYGKNLLNNQLIVCTNGLVFLELQFMLGNQRVNNIPASFVEIDYRGISQKRDFQGDTLGLIKKNIF